MIKITSICCLLCQGPLLAIYDLHSQFHSVYGLGSILAIYNLHSQFHCSSFAFLCQGQGQLKGGTKYFDLVDEGQGPLLDYRLCVKPPRLAARPSNLCLPSFFTKTTRKINFKKFPKSLSPFLHIKRYLNPQKFNAPVTKIFPYHNQSKLILTCTPRKNSSINQVK